MKIVILLPFFGVGGVERWAVLGQKALADKGYDVEINIFGPILVSPNVFSVKNVKISKINFFQFLQLFFGFNSPDLILTALTKMNFFVSLLGKFFRKPVITSVHLTLQRQEFETYLKFLIRKYIHKAICTLSTSVICVSSGIKSDLINIFKVDPRRLVVIYNPCFNNSDIFTKPSKTNKKLPVQFVAAGRLEIQKGFDLLLEAFLMLPKTLRHNSTLTIFGSGSKKENLKNLIPRSERNRIIFAGSRPDLLKNLRNFDVFILSSRYEGFGNVLAEALAANCFCVSYQIKHGPKEILMNGKLGLLIKKNNAMSLSEGLLFASNNFPITNRLFSNKLRISHLKKFTTETFSFSVANLIKKSI